MTVIPSFSASCFSMSSFCIFMYMGSDIGRGEGEWERGQVREEEREREREEKE